MSDKFMGDCRKCMLVLSFVLGCLASNGQSTLPGLDKFLNDNKKEFGTDFAALVYKDGKIIYQHETEEFKLKTRAPIAGASTWLTTALVMTFVDEGLLSLDDKVSTYIPIYATYAKSYITIRQCLSHQTGIEDNQRLASKMLARKKFESLEAEVELYAKREIDTNPGTDFNFGSMGINIAGRVLEVVSKKRFEYLIKQRIFTPLNMRFSSFAPEYDAVNPAGGASTTALDYMNFLTMLLNKGSFNGNRVLSEAAVKEMQTIQTGKLRKKFLPDAGARYEYGLGNWILATGAGGEATSLSCPGLYGTLPIVDYCRQYAALILPSKLLGEQSRQLQDDFKKQLDRQIPGSCD